MTDIRKYITSRLVILLACILLATACSGPLVLGSIYNGAASRITKEMKGYATFNKQQKSYINKSFAQYHYWHRKTQLPLYSQLLQSVSQELATEKPITNGKVAVWTQRINELSLAVRRCSPLTDSTEFLASLSAEQIKQIEQKIAEKQAIRTQKYNSETTDQRSTRRHKEILTWAKRAGLKFNTRQSDLLTQTLSQQISLGEQRLTLWQQWSDQFNHLLTNRDDAGFTAMMNKHISSLWTLTQTNYPNEWQASTQLWTGFLHQFLSLQTVKQKKALFDKTKSIAKTLNKISADVNVKAVTPQCFEALR